LLDVVTVADTDAKATRRGMDVEVMVVPTSVDNTKVDAAAAVVEHGRHKLLASRILKISQLWDWAKLLRSRLLQKLLVPPKSKARPVPFSAHTHP
jgi:predicted ATP-grasp superfamily ATP-dependent carboligase